MAGRFGTRRPPTIGYVGWMKVGSPVLIPEQGTYAGGFFYDGRAATLTEQTVSPLLGPNEMNNTRTGIVISVSKGPNAALFHGAFGVAASGLPVDEAFDKIVHALVAFETSQKFSPFASKYDAHVMGQVKLTPAQWAGLQLFTGSKTGRPGGAAVKSASCWTCHTVEANADRTRDLFTSSEFHNIGIPRNEAHPDEMQNKIDGTSPADNAMHPRFVDYGLGHFLYPKHNLPPGNAGNGSNVSEDYLRINGKFKTPTLRNVDKRPSLEFVKCYGHNGYFKSLEQIVHFYNTRNLTTEPGEVINFTERNPYEKLKGTPLWPPPEIRNPATLVNPTGVRGLIGNLQLTPLDEANLVAFLKTLSDDR